MENETWHHCLLQGGLCEEIILSTTYKNAAKSRLPLNKERTASFPHYAGKRMLRPLKTMPVLGPLPP